MSSLLSAWPVICSLHGKLIPLLNTPQFRNFNYRQQAGRQAGCKEEETENVTRGGSNAWILYQGRATIGRRLQESSVCRSICRRDFWPDGARRRQQQVVSESTYAAIRKLQKHRSGPARGRRNRELPGNKVAKLKLSWWPQLTIEFVFEKKSKSCLLSFEQQGTSKLVAKTVKKNVILLKTC